MAASRSAASIDPVSIGPVSIDSVFAQRVSSNTVSRDIAQSRASRKGSARSRTLQGIHRQDFFPLTVNYQEKFYAGAASRAASSSAKAARPKRKR
jgi:hypothetical protein